MCLNELIKSYIKQNGSIADIDDLARLLDGNEFSSVLLKNKFFPGNVHIYIYIHMLVLL